MATVCKPLECDSSLTADQQFIAIVCSDGELLRAEFDAIIAAQWSSLPPVGPDTGDAVERRPGQARRRRPSDAPLMALI